MTDPLVAEPSTEIVAEGDSVILYFSMTNTALIPSISAQGSTHNGFGFFAHADIIGQTYGTKVEPRHRSEAPRPAYILRVTPELFTASIPHRTQIIYHADISTIMMGLDVRPGCAVAEAGTGSASLSFSLASALGPTGKLFTFELDQNRAEHNTKLLHAVSPFPDVVTVEQRDVVIDGFPSTITVDAVFLDLPSPWLAVGNAHKILKQNGKVCTFSPSIEQVTKNVDALKQQGFHLIETFEIMLKPWGLCDVGALELSAGNKRKRGVTADEESSEPYRSPNFQSFQLPMRGHTSYLTFATKALDDEKQYPKPVLSLNALSKQISGITQ